MSAEDRLYGDQLTAVTAASEHPDTFIDEVIMDDDFVRVFMELFDEIKVLQPQLEEQPYSFDLQQQFEQASANLRELVESYAPGENPFEVAKKIAKRAGENVSSTQPSSAIEKKAKISPPKKQRRQKALSGCFKGTITHEQIIDSAEKERVRTGKRIDISSPDLIIDGELAYTGLSWRAVREAANRGSHGLRPGQRLDNIVVLKSLKFGLIDVIWELIKTGKKIPNKVTSEDGALKGRTRESVAEYISRHPEAFEGLKLFQIENEILSSQKSVKKQIIFNSKPSLKFGMVDLVWHLIKTGQRVSEQTIKEQTTEEPLASRSRKYVREYIKKHADAFENLTLEQIEEMALGPKPSLKFGMVDLVWHLIERKKRIPQKDEIQDGPLAGHNGNALNIYIYSQPEAFDGLSLAQVQDIVFGKNPLIKFGMVDLVWHLIKTGKKIPAKGVVKDGILEGRTRKNILEYISMHPEAFEGLKLGQIENSILQAPKLSLKFGMVDLVWHLIERKKRIHKNDKIQDGVLAGYNEAALSVYISKHPEMFCGLMLREIQDLVLGPKCKRSFALLDIIWHLSETNQRISSKNKIASGPLAGKNRRNIQSYTRNHTETFENRSLAEIEDEILSPKSSLKFGMSDLVWHLENTGKRLRAKDEIEGGALKGYTGNALNTYVLNHSEIFGGLSFYNIQNMILGKPLKAQPKEPDSDRHLELN